MSVLIILLVSTLTLTSQSGGNQVIDVIMSGYSAKMFTAKPVSDSEIDLIIKCGMKAPSARNKQLWKFTVIKDSSIIKEAIPNTITGNILICISGPEGNQQGNIDFDCALATENMYIAAQSLGLGAHIYTGPVNNINLTKKQLLEIPEGYRVVSVLKVGNIDRSVDATSSASTRKKPEEVVNYR
ncbi:MAG: nitroreductase family protein [Bacteroidales bacterium]|jgi:nitroreductase|nr:nitroreductase family protein [Bacteroidales bacterium]